MELDRKSAEAEKNILDDYITYLMNVYEVWSCENSEWLGETEEAVNDVVEEMEECDIMLPSLEAA